MNQKSKLRFLERFLGKADIISDEALFICHFCHHHKKKLSVNLTSGCYKCWVCGQSGRSLRFLLKPFCSEEEIRTIHKQFKGTYEEKRFDFIPSLPNGFVSLVEIESSDASSRFFNYLDRRNVTREQILQFKLGVTFDDDKFKNRIIFPSFDADGFLNFVVGRSLDDKAWHKYDNIDVPKGWKNNIILNELNIDFQKPLTLVEGFFDLFNAGDNATFLAGNDLSMNSKLFSKIVENNTEIYLALDLDATKFAYRLANKFFRHDIKVYLVDLGCYKDPGSMRKEQFQQKLSEASLFTEKDFLLLKAREALC